MRRRSRRGASSPIAPHGGLLAALIALALAGLAACGGASRTTISSPVPAAPSAPAGQNPSASPYPAGVPRSEPQLDDYYVALRHCTYTETRGKAAAAKSCQCEINRMHSTFASAHDFGVFVGRLRARDPGAKATLDRVRRQCA